MNFFGHAVVARQVDDHPAFVLGAMAPDLLRMCGAVASAPTSPKVAAGEAHHLAVDARFHASPAFTALAAWAARGLIDGGVARGPARGAAHIGIELALDGSLADDARARAAYQRSLADAETAEAPFVFVDEASGERWRTLVLRLRAGTVPDGYRDPDFLAARLIGALARRPRLALAPEAASVLRAFLPALMRRVADAAPELTSAL